MSEARGGKRVKALGFEDIAQPRAQSRDGKRANSALGGMVSGLWK